MNRIYHITNRSRAILARETGEYRAESLDTEGFIHCSQLAQVLGVANAFYVGQKDLVILVIDPSRLKSELRFEAPVHPNSSVSDTTPAANSQFPHIYGPLNFDAVDSVVDFPASLNGRFELPELLL